jgi:predicted nucleic acid-binding protein
MSSIPAAANPHPAVRPALATAPLVVLDTNAVLDWLVFRDPACDSWAARLAGGQVRWLASRPMREELAHVLGRGIGHAWAPHLPTLWQTWDRFADMVAPATLGGALPLRCTDPDDQKFIDLALAHRARWLVSRDRAVLKLGRRARSWGVEVLTPESWLRALNFD